MAILFFIMVTLIIDSIFEKVVNFKMLMSRESFTSFGSSKLPISSIVKKLEYFSVPIVLVCRKFRNLPQVIL